MTDRKEINTIRKQRLMNSDELCLSHERPATSVLLKARMLNVFYNNFLCYLLKLPLCPNNKFNALSKKDKESGVWGCCRPLDSRFLLSHTG